MEILLHSYNAEHTEIISALLVTYITNIFIEHLVRTFTVS